MSSFKKLRLDPELPSTHRNQSGANDSGGRGFLDGSSFSSSTSGGSGAYGRSSGPIRARYSQPFGAPSPSTSSFSRFAPYYFGKERRTSLRVPLIRAKRDDSDSEGGRPSSRASLNSSLGGDSTTSATSSTAQRIIETLQNLSTPVMNAGKIRIDQDIKAVQPLAFGSGASLSRISPGSSLNRSTGPPKLRSSLLLTNPSPANQTTPIFGSGDPRRLFCIPKMVDAATNTEKEETSLTSPMKFMSKTIGSPSPGKSQLTATNLKPVSTNSLKDDNNSEEEFHECSSEFSFSNPWAPDVFDRFLTSCKDDKSVNKGNIGMQLPLINGFKDTTSASLDAPQVSSKSVSIGASPQLSVNTPKLSSVASHSASNFSGGLGSKGIGSSPLNNITFGKSQIPSSNEKKIDAPNSFSSESNKSGASPLTGFTFGSPTLKNNLESSSSKTAGLANASTKDMKTTATLSVDKVDAPKSDSLFTKSSTDSKSPLPPLSSLTKSSTKWRCPTCMVENDPVVAACACCGEKNTNQAIAAKATLSTSTDKKKWRCPTCMVENEQDAASCVCCSEKNPNPVAVTSTPLSSLASKKWRCSTCMVENEPTAANCVCCSEKNPNPVTEKKDSSNAVVTAPVTAFKFGVANTATSSSAAPTGNSSFVFGAPTARSDNQQAPAAAFKFGLPTTTTSTSAVSTTTSAPPAPSQSASSAAASTFKFGSDTASTTPMYGFNMTPTTAGTQSTTSSSTVTTTSSSTFSSPKVSASSTTTSSGGIFGSSNFQASQSNTVSSFKFGSTAPTATNDAQKPSATPSFSFGPTDNSKPPFSKNMFSFGDSGGMPGANSSVLSPPAPTSTPSLGGASNFNFGSNNPTASPFGQLQSIAKSPTQPSAGGLFQFGSGTSSNPQPPSLTPAPTPSFSLTPNLNFGATPGIAIPFGNPTQPTPNAGSQPPPALFQFNSTPSTSDPPGARKIKKAVRRFKN